MIKIDDGREYFFQWDTNRYLTVTEDFQELHFSRAKFGKAIAVKVEDGKVKVPDEILVCSGELYVFGIVEEDGKFTKIEKTFIVEKRPKPENYDGKSNMQIEFEKVYNLIGNLEDLNTEQKSNLVYAINEVLEKVGNGGTGSGEFNSWAMVQYLVQSGLASYVFEIGDQLVCNHETYGELVWDIIGFDQDVPADSTKKHSLTLQLHNVLFKASYTGLQGMFYAENTLPAGTYNFTIPAGIDDEYGGGKTYYFTLKQEVPQGGIIYFPWENIDATSVSVVTYPDYVGQRIEFAKVQEGTEGISLESLGELNSFELHLGSNNWKSSPIRQYLNSDAEAGNVWHPTNKYSLPPGWLRTETGFLKGLDKDFLDVIGTVGKTTVLSDFDGGAVETHPERFFLLSSTEVYGWDETITPEGEVYSFYKENSDNNEPSNNAYDSNRVKYLIGSEKTAEWWLRTPQKDSIENTRCVASDGRIGRVGVRYAYGVCPACCIV